MIHCYLDDGMTMNGSFICMAGYAGTDSAWEDLSRSWVTTALHHKLPNAYLHASDFLAGQGIYEELDLCTAQRLEVIREFISLINTHLHLGVAIGIDANALKEISKNWPQRLEKNEFCLTRVVRHLQEFGPPLDTPLALICDSDNSAMHLLGAYRTLKKRSEFKNTLCLLGFGDDQFLQPLQAADLLACAVVNEYTHKYENRNLKIPPLAEFFKPGKTSRINYSSELWDSAEFERQAPAIRAAAETSYAARTGQSS